MKHPSFYETQKEASIRLKNTFILYDGELVYVLEITEHPDGILRIYIEPTGRTAEEMKALPYPSEILQQFPSGYPGLGDKLDAWIKDHPEREIMRKHMSSPLFNNFRPYPLGMCNYGTQAYYLERQPNRNSHQGLVKSMVVANHVTPGQKVPDYMNGISLFSPEFKACVMGDHPSPHESLAGLKNPCFEDEGVAFHREFALMRGPIGMIFLSYRAEVIGVLPDADFSRLHIGKDYHHTKEVAEDLNLFGSIKYL